MLKKIANYFRYNKNGMYFGYGFLLTLPWVLEITAGKELWLFILCLWYLAYCGNRVFVILSSLGLIAFTFHAYLVYLPEGSVFLSKNSLISLIYVLFFRDMYFLYRYRINAFTYTATNEEDIERGKRIFKIGLVWIFIITFSIYGLISLVKV